MEPAPSPITLDAWRARRTATLTIADGLIVTLRRVNLVDLAARGRIPTPLLPQVEAIIRAAETSGAIEISLASFAEYGAAIDLVVLAAVISPPVAEEPSETHLGLSEIPMLDKIRIFTWAQQEAAQLATFPEPARGGTARVPRGKGVRPAAE